jgi:hypothetical protein
VLIVGVIVKSLVCHCVEQQFDWRVAAEENGRAANSPSTPSAHAVTQDDSITFSNAAR